MSHADLSLKTRPFRPMLLILALAPALPGCVSAANDVRDYYREMAYNYRAAEEKAKMDALTLEGETKMLAKNGDFQRLRRTKRELDRIKAWEAKCAKQEERFEKAARWTEDHYHLDKQPAKAKPAAVRDEEKAAGTEPAPLPPLFEAKDL
ncbi:MAG: hypothetical protein ACLQIB_06360 [Isosphaeraceae bacterium]